MRKSKRAQFTSCDHLVPDESETAIMFQMENGLQSVGRYDPSEKQFISSGFPATKHPVSEVVGWKPLVNDAKSYYARLKHRKSVLSQKLATEAATENLHLSERRIDDG